jgi:hypothetical protein
VAPFEQAFNLLKPAAEYPRSGEVLGTNLFRCTLTIETNPDSLSPLKGTPDEQQKILEWQRGTLTAEIRILNPTHVVFFTGPNYDTVLRDEFPGLELRAVDGRPDREFAKAIHPTLPGYAVRTYHPGYLRRTRAWSWIEQIRDEIYRKPPD